MVEQWESGGIQGNRPFIGDLDATASQPPFPIDLMPETFLSETQF